MGAYLKLLSFYRRENCEENEQISCFKPGGPSAEGYKVLKEQMMIFSEEQSIDNTFEITKPNIEDAHFIDNIISDDKEYDDID